MAIAVTNELTFGGVDSTQYGIVIAGFGEYGAPKRATESFYVPGRNGALVIDKGYYENILIEYDVVVQASTQQEFREAVSDYRNAIVSQLGYQRLTDKYHPEEYRLAMYDSGFDENPSFHGSNAVFTLKFNCKPQRFLIDGEDEVAITSGDTLTNPTLYDAHPLIIAEGTGAINIGDQQIAIVQGELGQITLAASTEAESRVEDSATATVTFNGSLLNTGDEITTSAVVYLEFKVTDGSYIIGFTYGTEPVPMTYKGFDTFNRDRNAWWEWNWPVTTLKKGTASTASASGTMQFTTDSSGSSVQYQIPFTVTYSYDGNQTITYTVTMADPNNGHVAPTNRKITVNATTAYSTRLTVVDPIYIDLDIGEAYTNTSGVLVPVNSIVDIGSDLPVLYPGENEITNASSITSLKIVPRWWQL